MKTSEKEEMLEDIEGGIETEGFDYWAVHYTSPENYPNTPFIKEWQSYLKAREKFLEKLLDFGVNPDIIQI